MGSRLQREPGGCTVQGSRLKVLVGGDATVTVFGADGEVLREEAPPERRGEAGTIAHACGQRLAFADWESAPTA